MGCSPYYRTALFYKEGFEMIQSKAVSIIRKTNANNITIAENLTFTINKGEWISITGRSGSGKTSLLNCLAGFLPPAKGSVIIDDFKIYELKYHEKQAFRRENIGFIFQDFKLLPQYTVVENIILPLTPYQNREILEQKAVKLMNQLGIDHRLRHFPDQLSGGEQQRVGIARALINQPSILICDEPTGNLDTTSRDQVIAILRELHKKGQTILLATHDYAVAEQGDRYFKLNQKSIQVG